MSKHSVISSFSGGGACVEVWRLENNWVAIGHSKHLELPPLRLTSKHYKEMIAALQHDYTLQLELHGITQVITTGGSVTLGNNTRSLRYTADEWVAFVAGIKNGEFDLSSLPVRA